MKTVLKSITTNNNKQLSLIESSFDEDTVYIVQIQDTRTDKVEWIDTQESLDKANNQFDLLVEGLSV